MEIPFTVDQFYGVFRDYNSAVWPAQWFLGCIALIAVAVSLRPRPWSGAVVSALLGFLWAWIAVVYHLAFFTRISPPAYAFAALSLAGSVTFFWQGVFRRRLTFKWSSGQKAMFGTTLIIFSLIIYPMLSIYAGHPYPSTPTFGLPCPTTIFTIGLLAFAVPPVPRSPLVVPVLWCLVGVQAAFLFGVWSDLGLGVAGIVGLGLLASASRWHRKMHP
ncbi:MAG: hypothetical protein IPN53_00460 [Comamonadaceae bacterium]|nr:hypothetical protein [Comamonadaceae bacterium]